MPKKPLFFVPPPKTPDVKLPKQGELSKADLLMEAIAGLVPFHEPNEEHFATPEAYEQALRANAAGQLGSMLGITIAPRLAKPLLQQLLRTGSGRVDEAIDYFIRRYPRLMSHVKDVRFNEHLLPDTGGQMRPFPHRPGRPTASIELHPTLASPTSPVRPVETLGHELAHVAQGLRNQEKMQAAYKALGDVDTVEGHKRYLRLPYEQEGEIARFRQLALEDFEKAAQRGQPALPGIVSAVGRLLRAAQPRKTELQIEALERALRRDYWKNAPGTPLQRQLPFPE